MGEINEREQELNAARDKLLEQEEEMRQISIQREKLTLERDYLVGELKTMQKRMDDLQVKFHDQARLLVNVVSHSKNPATNGNNTMLNQSMNTNGEGPQTMEEAAKDESMRADRITRQMNRSSFMGLGENPPKLMSEVDPTQTQSRSMAGPGQGGVYAMD